MPFVAELYFDPSTEERIRGVWKTLDEAGISDSMPKGGYRPHVSLGVCDHLETNSLAQELTTFTAKVTPFRLLFPNIGIFSTSEGVVYLGATVTAELLNVHTAFHEIFKKHAKEQREYYTVGQWVPHCTLAFGLSEDQIAEAVIVCRQMDLPVSTEVKGIGVVEVSSTGCRTLSSFSLKTSDSSELNDELRSEYDETLLKNGVRGKYAKQ
ncbi:2'-5' RNA ligase family protein [Candidatus Poribacteria bacterium]|nr:2'-5' RNA ligase family protein [Candidatus Poribacteria bacterium]